MVVRLIGKIDGKEMILERAEGDWWEVTVPPPKSGTYIADFTAYDDAGNVAYCTKILVTFRPEDLCLRLEPCPHGAGTEGPAWTVSACAGRYVSRMLPGDFLGMVKTSGYYAELVRRAACRK